jgi:hypothetical protein
MLEDKQLSHWRFYHHLQRWLLWVLPHHPSYNIHMKMGDLIGMYLKPHWDVSQATKSVFVCLGEILNHFSQNNNYYCSFTQNN